MNKPDNNLWLFDYNQGFAYEEFSKSEDINGLINECLLKNYNFKNKTILEIGAGSGKFTSFLSKLCSKLYVVEKNKILMEINRGKNNDKNNIDFILSDIKDLKMKKNSIDVIFAGWSMTSMRNLFDITFKIFKKILQKNGIILLIENAGNDEFSKITNIEEFTLDIKKTYIEMGFIEKEIIDTTIRLPHENIFYNAFPNKNKVNLTSLDIQHKVLILEMPAFYLQKE